MPSDALPCIVCGMRLDNVYMDIDNQPEGGVAFTSPGHYGSKVFDPEDGTYIEINVCDHCLTAAGTKERVLVQRHRVPVRFEDALVGYVTAGDPPVYWRKGLPGYDPEDAVRLDEEDLENDYWRTRVDWLISPDVVLEQADTRMKEDDD